VPGAGAAGGCPWRESGTPRPLRPAPVGQGEGPRWESPPADAGHRRRSRLASSAPVGTETAVRSPARARRASGTASRRSVVTRSPGFFGPECGGHPPAGGVLFRQRAGEPVATRTRCRDEEAGCGHGWPLTDAVIDVTLTRPPGAQSGHLRAVLLGNLRHGTRLVVDLHADEACARRRQGCPPSVWG
jgi:hypothetical protein